MVNLSPSLEINSATVSFPWLMPMGVLNVPVAVTLPLLIRDNKTPLLKETTPALPTFTSPLDAPSALDRFPNFRVPEMTFMFLNVGTRFLDVDAVMKSRTTSSLFVALTIKLFSAILELLFAITACFRLASINSVSAKPVPVTSKSIPLISPPLVSIAPPVPIVSLPLS